MNIKSDGMKQNPKDTNKGKLVAQVIVFIIGAIFIGIAFVSPNVTGFMALFLFLIGAGMTDDAYKKISKDKI